MLSRVRADALAIATQQLGVMLTNGVNIIPALATLARTDDLPLRRVIEALRDSIEKGHTLSEAMARQPQVFSKLYLRSVRAGERSGRLHYTLSRLGQQLARNQENRNRLKAALTYPACVIVFSSLLIAFLLYVQVPLFMRFFGESGAPIPPLTRLLLVVSRPEAGLALLLLVVVSVLQIRLMQRTTEGRTLLQSRLYRLPGLGPVLRTAELAQLSSELSTLLSNGLDMLTALQILSTPPAGSPLSDSLAGVGESLRAGHTLAEALDRQGPYPRLLVAMARAGEETGKICQCLDWYSGMASQEVDYAVAALLSILEPVLMGLLGAVVTVIVLASFLPTYQLLVAF